MLLLAAGDDADCGSAAAASLAITRVHALLSLLFPNEEEHGTCAAAGHFMKTLGILKLQCFEYQVPVHECAHQELSIANEEQSQQHQQNTATQNPAQSFSQPNDPSVLHLEPLPQSPALSKPLCKASPRITSRSQVPLHSAPSPRSSTRSHLLPSAKPLPSAESCIAVSSTARSQVGGSSACSPKTPPRSSQPRDPAAIAASTHSVLNSRISREEDFRAVIAVSMLMEATKQVIAFADAAASASPSATNVCRSEAG
jgi:hypothetical protein